MFRFAAGGVGGAANKNDRKFLGFAPRELVERGRGASVIRQNPADFARNTFELRPIHTVLKTAFPKGRFIVSIDIGDTLLIHCRYADDENTHQYKRIGRGEGRPAKTGGTRPSSRSDQSGPPAGSRS